MKPACTLVRTPVPGGARRILPALAALTLGAAVAGCGNLTAGGLGEVVVEVGSDGPASTASSFGNAWTGSLEGGDRSGNGGSGPRPWETGGSGGLGWEAGPALNNAGGAFQGVVTVELTVALRNDAGEWFEVTDGVQRVEVAASGTAASEIGRSSLPEGSYDRIRVTFHRAEVLVTSAPPGQGFPEGTVVVDFEGAPVLVLERPLGGLLDQGGQRIRVNLRASAWVRSAVQGRVPASTFREAVQVTASPGGV